MGKPGEVGVADLVKEAELLQLLIEGHLQEMAVILTSNPHGATLGMILRGLLNKTQKEYDELRVRGH